uniref:DDE_Tnp_1_7 domain-containing protein n=1 Tax=Meloidogyne hapla TaxID=6305 RepID=A0A1I8BV97_MELHA
MELDQHAQFLSLSKIKRQDKTTLPPELLVDIFKVINTYSDGLPTDMAVDTDNTIIISKQQELWSKYAKKMMTSSLIIYSFAGEAFRRSKVD